MDKKILLGEIGTLYYDLEEQIKNQKIIDSNDPVLNECLMEMQYNTRIMLNKRINEYAEKYGQDDLTEFQKYYV